MHWQRKNKRVADLRTHLSFIEVFASLIQLIYKGGEGLEVWDDELLAEGLSEQDNVALDTPDEQTTNSMQKYCDCMQIQEKFVNRDCKPEVWQTSMNVIRDA